MNFSYKLKLCASKPARTQSPKPLSNIKDCYVISTNPKVDKKVFDIETALKDAISIWADEGTLIVFGDAEIIYREAEGPNKKWISKQTKSKSVKHN